MIIAPTGPQPLPLVVDPTQQGSVAVAVPCWDDPRNAPPQHQLASQLVLAIRWLQFVALQLVQRVGQLELAVAERDRLDDGRSDAELDESRLRYTFGIDAVRESAKVHTLTRETATDEPSEAQTGSALDAVKLD